MRAKEGKSPRAPENCVAEKDTEESYTVGYCFHGHHKKWECKIHIYRYIF